MEPNASREVFQSEPRPNQAVELPVTQTPKPNRTIIAKLAIGVLVVVFGVLSVFLVFNRRGLSQKAESVQTVDAAWVEYKNPDGFMVSYPSDLNFNQDTGVLVFPSAKKLGFSVKKLEGPLLQKAVEAGTDYSFFTIDSRTGFEIKKEDATYYYFPLFGENYLEIVSEESGDLVDQIVTGIKFTPPQTQG